MKKILYFLLTITLILTFTTETFAMRVPRSVVLSDGIRPISKMISRSKSDLVLSEATTVKLKKQEELLPVYRPDVTLTVVDNTQVKVKYDFWIVKVIKDLFSLN